MPSHCSRAPPSPAIPSHSRRKRKVTRLPSPGSSYLGGHDGVRKDGTVFKTQVVLTEHKIKFHGYRSQPNDGPKERKKPKRMRTTTDVETNDEKRCAIVVQAQKTSGELERNTQEWRSGIR
jgi:hypothetical protein